jgi:Mn2+/Fe2+ NRAMP family transporter
MMAVRFSQRWPKSATPSAKGDRAKGHEKHSMSQKVGAPLFAADEVKQPERPKLLQLLGPGLITGASDDDPSGIATYSQVGAQFGYSLSWVMRFSWPLMCAIQEIAARIGRVTGRGIAGNLKLHYPIAVVYGIVTLLVIANVINLGADLGAMGAALKLLIGGPALAYVAAFGLVTVLLEVFSRYSRYVSVLKWLTVSLLPMSASPS